MRTSQELPFWLEGEKNSLQKGFLLLNSGKTTSQHRAKL